MTLRARRGIWRRTTQRRRRAEERERKETMALQATYHKESVLINRHKMTEAQRTVSHQRVDAHKTNLRQIRDSVRNAESALAQIDRQLEAQSNPGQKAVAYLMSVVGRTEHNNRASWLDAWARKYVGSWMLGQPWCGLACIVAYSQAGKSLPKDTVSTVAILNRARAGNFYQAVSPGNARPGDLVVFNFPGGAPAEHVGLARGPAKNGVIPTVEGNTSPGSGGSQDNGGGIYARTRPVGLIAVVARPKF